MAPANASGLALVLIARPNPVVLAEVLAVLGSASANAVLAFEPRPGAANRDFGRSRLDLAGSRRAADIVLVDCVRA